MSTRTSKQKEGGYYHPTPQDCGKKVRLPNPDFQYTTSKEVVMVITGPRGRMSLFKGYDEELASQAIRKFIEFNKDG